CWRPTSAGRLPCSRSSRTGTCSLRTRPSPESSRKGDAMTATRVEHDSLGPVNVPADRLWGAQPQRSLEHFSIGDDLIPREMIPAYALVKKAAALVNHEAGRLGDAEKALIVRACDEILEGQHRDQFPLH